VVVPIEYSRHTVKIFLKCITSVHESASSGVEFFHETHPALIPRCILLPTRMHLEIHSHVALSPRRRRWRHY